MKTKSNLYYDFLPKRNEFQKEILAGLLKDEKSIPPKFLYDERGSELFDQICELEEYYPIHAELEILCDRANEIAEWIGPGAILIEPGCGSCLKVRFLLDVLAHPRAYVGMDISKDYLLKTALKLQEDYPDIPILPIVGDYTERMVLPEQLKKQKGKRVIFFPGSTIGNLHPTEARELLARMGRQVRKGGGLLIGVDMKKDTKTLELAYDDPKGVTAEFNFNLLDRLNREFSASFDRTNFKYDASYNRKEGRVEMFLISRVPQWVKIGRRTIHLSENEPIHTENSYKYTVPEFNVLAQEGGFELKATWKDRRKLFCVYYFERM